MSFKNLRTSIGDLSKRKPIPASVIDILGTRCSVRLSGKGKLLTNLLYSGKSPKKGDSVYVDYSRGNPIVITSDTGDKITAGEYTGKPIITAALAIPTSTLETPVSIAYGNVTYRGEWSVDVNYLVNDLITLSEMFYICSAANFNESPPNIAYWIPVSNLETAIRGFVYTVFYGDVSPELVFTIPAGQSLDVISVEIVEAWDGSGASITVGTAGDPDLVFSTSDIELTIAGIVFEKNVNISGVVDIQVTIIPGSGASSGSIIIQGSTTGD